MHIIRDSCPSDVNVDVSLIDKPTITIPYSIPEALVYSNIGSTAKDIVEQQLSTILKDKYKLLDVLSTVRNDITSDDTMTS